MVRWVYAKSRDDKSVRGVHLSKVGSELTNRAELPIQLIAGKHCPTQMVYSLLVLMNTTTLQLSHKDSLNIFIDLV